MTFAPRVVAMAISMVITTVILLLSLVGLLLWSTSGFQYDGISTTGVLLGMAVMGITFALVALLDRNPGPWAASAYTTLLAVAELIIGVALLFSFSIIAVRLLPVPVARWLFGDVHFIDAVAICFIGLGTLLSARNWGRFTRQKARALHAELESAEARAVLAQREKEQIKTELMLLRAQLEPHFLWNTLGSVQQLVKKQPDVAEQLIMRLVDYLRLAVPLMRGGAATLAIEFGLAEAFLDIMKVRMGGRLTTQIELPDHLRDRPFAPLLIQTLVENAIKHGVEPKIGQVSISLRANLIHSTEENLVIEVIDNGVGLSATPTTAGTRLGLRNVRETLFRLYGESSHLSVADAPGGGVIARISVPQNRERSAQ